ncbi:MAG: hypothetical protein KAX09_08955 [Candidatus Heimdallarchaeota archaeon]|nr:hypothetical protein [Candidatus Heimdallarchaeota archaeon]MCK4291098.1 hypothetical protein [Candidatus Heimdallarchaeota archaeon]
MSKKKSKGGRPRIHETGADRSRAYYERKKAKMKELEDKVKKLETKTSGKKTSGKVLKLKEIEKFDWQKITPNEISLMDIQKLEQLTKTFREKLTENPAIKGQLQHLIQSLISSDILDTSAEITVEDILGQLDPILDDVVDTLQESTQQQTLLYLMEAELANRERLLIRDYKLEILQSKVEELKKETKEKELKQKQK